MLKGLLHPNTDKRYGHNSSTFKTEFSLCFLLSVDWSCKSCAPSPAGYQAYPWAPVASSPSVREMMRCPLALHVFPCPGWCRFALHQLDGLQPRGVAVSLVWGCCFHGDPAGCYSARCQHVCDGCPPLCDGSASCGGHREGPVQSPRTGPAWLSTPWWSPSGLGWSLSVGPGFPLGGGWWLWPPHLHPTNQQGVHFDAPFRWDLLFLH